MNLELSNEVGRLQATDFPALLLEYFDVSILPYSNVLNAKQGLQHSSFYSQATLQPLNVNMDFKLASIKKPLDHFFEALGAGQVSSANLQCFTL